MLGETDSKRRRGQQRMRFLDKISDSMDMILRKLWEIVKHRGACLAEIHGFSESDLKKKFPYPLIIIFVFYICNSNRVRHLPLFERAPAAYVSGANFLS